jgi:hypothetical protein
MMSMEQRLRVKLQEVQPSATDSFLQARVTAMTALTSSPKNRTQANKTLGQLPCAPETQPVDEDCADEEGWTKPSHAMLLQFDAWGVAGSVLHFAGDVVRTGLSAFVSQMC